MLLHLLYATAALLPIIWPAMLTKQVMGQAMAAYVLCAVAKQPFLPEPVAPMSLKTRHKMAQHLLNREFKVPQRNSNEAV